MREILFKAKRLDNDEWVEGSLVYDNEAERHYIVTERDLHWGMCCRGEFDGNFTAIKNETICQYTGLTDKNGNKIWENDVCYIPYERLEDSYCKVVFRRGGFIGELADGCEDCLLNRRIEVIGNIFDNPELIGE